MIATQRHLDTVDELALLRDYLCAEKPLMQILADHNLPLPDFLEWLESEHIQDLLRRYLAAAQLQAQFRAVQASAAAVEALRVVLASDVSPAERRRAASALLRAAKPQRRSTRGQRDPVREHGMSDVTASEGPPPTLEKPNSAEPGHQRSDMPLPAAARAIATSAATPALLNGLDPVSLGLIADLTTLSPITTPTLQTSRLSHSIPPTRRTTAV